jgi:hypothetical protein
MTFGFYFLDEFLFDYCRIIYIPFQHLIAHEIVVVSIGLQSLYKRQAKV